MKMNVVAQFGFSDPKLKVEDIFQFFWCMEMDVVSTTKQPHTHQQTDQSEIMIAMEVGNVYVADLTFPDFIFCHLELGTLPTVDQEEVFCGLKNLGCRIAAVGRNSRIVT